MRLSKIFLQLNFGNIWDNFFVPSKPLSNLSHTLTPEWKWTILDVILHPEVNIQICINNISVNFQLNDMAWLHSASSYQLLEPSYMSLILLDLAILIHSQSSFLILYLINLKLSKTVISTEINQWLDRKILNSIWFQISLGPCPSLPLQDPTLWTWNYSDSGHSGNVMMLC